MPPHLRFLCLGLTAVAAGAGAGLAFLQAVREDPTPPLGAAIIRPQPAPAAVSASPNTRQPPPSGERTDPPLVRTPPPAGGERAGPSEGKKGTAPYRTRLAQPSPGVAFEEGRLAEGLEDVGLPRAVRRWRDLGW
jgi:hypothetical protein